MIDVVGVFKEFFHDLQFCRKYLFIHFKLDEIKRKTTQPHQLTVVDQNLIGWEIHKRFFPHFDNVVHYINVPYLTIPVQVVAS